MVAQALHRLPAERPPQVSIPGQVHGLPVQAVRSVREVMASLKSIRVLAVAEATSAEQEVLAEVALSVVSVALAVLRSSLAYQDVRPMNQPRRAAT